jgi:DNA (cytosine-5)-methyltransferase 1
VNALYNEIDPYASAWLENLIRQRSIASGAVDRRSVVDLKPADVRGRGQRHFFAGIGGWSLALRLAGVPDDADVWTGSCPCQGLSDAGKRLGARDPRHLWPAWFELIRECMPPVIFGEQVASRLGLDWLDLVRSDLEGRGYAFGASDLCAASVGAPHIRQRLFFVAFAGGERREGERLRVQPGQSRSSGPEIGGAAKLTIQLEHSSSSRSWRDCGGLPDAQASREGEGREPRRVADEPVIASEPRCGCEGGDYCTDPGCDWTDEHRERLGNAEEQRRNEGWRSGSHGRTTVEPGRPGTRSPERIDDRDVPFDEPHPNFLLDDSAMADAAGRSGSVRVRREQRNQDDERRPSTRTRGERDASQGALDPWQPCDWLPCTDGVSRPVEPGAFPLAHGVSGRVVVRRAVEQAGAEVEEEHWYNRTGALAGFGNAIVPQVAAEFIKAAIAAHGALK